MVSFSAIGTNIGFGFLGRAHVNVRTYNSPLKQQQPDFALSSRRPSYSTLRKIARLRDALQDLEPARLRTTVRAGTSGSAPSYANAISQTALVFGQSAPTELSSVEEVNTAPTSFTAFGPTIAGSTATAPWIGATADAAIGGTYDGSNGTGTLTFRVQFGGTHTVDDLKIDVYAPDDSFIETIEIKTADAIDKVYTLSNGLTLTLNAGDLIKDETFTVELDTLSTFSTTPHPVASTADVTIGGVYDGSQGTGAISFLVTSGGTHGTDDLAVEVYAPDDTLIDTINVQQTDPIGQEYQLSNGLTFQLGSGTLVLNETFAINVNDQVGSSVDPDKSFDGTRNDIPNFDVGLAVTAGSFDINGVTINVFASDTLNSVVDRITQSAADVTATFDAGSEIVLLTRNTVTAGETIVLANDTSGFLAATKLANATPVTYDDSITTPIAQIASLAAVSSGAIQINGVAISIDVDADSIEDVVNRINASAANVTANFDTGTNLLSVVANEFEDLVLDSGTTGFFGELTINDDTYVSTPGQAAKSARPGGVNQQDRRHVADVIANVSRALNDLFENTDSNSVDTSLEAFRDEVYKAIGESFDAEGTEFETDFGINFDFDPDAKQVFRFSAGNRDKLRSQLKSSSGAAAFREFLFGNAEKQDSLVERLTAVAKQFERDIAVQLRSVGILVDTYV